MRGTRKKLVGTVVGDKMQKTAVVQVESIYMHPKYQKQTRQVKKYKVHDEKKEAKVGDRVEITETRPLSRTKSWRLTRVLES